MFCLANCCRLCLSKSSTLVEFNFCLEDNVSYAKKLTDIAPQLLADTEICYPTGICKKCQEQLDKTYNFLQQCFKSKEILLAYVTKLKQSTKTSSDHMENKLVKKEIDIGDVIALPEFALNAEGTKLENSLLATTESNSFDTYIKEEVFDSAYISEQDLHTTEFVPISIKEESENVLADDSNSISFHKEEESEIEEDDLESDASSSPVEFEPIRKNEKTPRLKRYKCIKCVKKFSRYSHLLRHSRVHTGNRPFPCTTCNKSFSQMENLERHQLIHSDIKPHTCTECGKSFRDKSYYKKHIQLHEGKRYTCDVCGKAYTNSRNLMIHSRKHTGERPYECGVCKNKYADPDTLRKHKKKCENKSASSNMKCQEYLQNDGDTAQVAK